ncbi:hypothetical protein EIP86_003923 [Pleurotus ostreatoroseus]|nr:hypothetical protein EIP86_003923 [Pleurotus ostreatoroseus]
MRRRSTKHGRDRHSGARDLLKMLLNEENESSQNRRFLRTVLAKLDTETQRAQEAERRALELAANFKMVNDDRRAAKQELDRVNEELRLYKVQYDNAQREILRGREILKDMETQRDDAEVVAARARTEARKLREEKIAYHAREAGRREGYKEGLQRGLEQARFETSGGEQLVDGSGDRGTLTDIGERESLLEELPVKNLPSADEQSPSIVSPTPQHPIPPLDQQPASRFHEHGIGRTPSPGVQTWLEEHDSPKYVRPPSGIPERHVPPDGWIPPTDEHNQPQVPPAFALDPQTLTPRASQQQLATPPPGIIQTGRASVEPPFTKGYASSLDSVPASLQSTAISSFDIVTNPPEPRLSVIRETSMEYSPESHAQTIPEPIVFPAGPTHHESSWGAREESEGTRTPRSYHSKVSLDRVSEYGNPRRPSIYSAVESSNPSQSSLHSRPYPVPTDPTMVPPPPTLTVHSPPTTPSPYPPSGPPMVVIDPDPNMLAPPSSRPVSTQSRQSSRSRSGKTHTSHDDSIVIDIQPPSHSPTASSPADTPRSDNGDFLLSPNRPPPPLPVMPPRSPRHAPPIPTEPNSLATIPSPKGIPIPLYGNMPGSMPGGMPGGMPGSAAGPMPGNLIATASDKIAAGALGAIPTPGSPYSPALGSRPGTAPLGGPPPGFIPLGPSSPRVPSPSLHPAQSTPRAAQANLYGDPYRRPAPPRRPSSASTVSSDAELPPSLGRHGRSRSEAQGMHSTDFPGIAVKSPSSSSGSSKSSRSSRYAGSKTSAPRMVSAPIYQSANPSGAFSPRSAQSGVPPSGHQRSFSMFAGSTPGPQLRRTPSEASDGSAGSRSSKLGKTYTHYNPSEYVDPSFLASSDNLAANVLSPSTAENTRMNAASRSRTDLPGVLRPGGSSPALSYVSLR